MKFNIDLLKDKKVVINCRTQDEAIQFINYIDELVGSKSECNQWWIHEKFTCYSLNKNNSWSSCDIRFYKSAGYKILSFDEVLVKDDELWYKNSNNFPCLVVKNDGLYYETWGRASHCNSEVELCVNNEYWYVSDWRRVTTEEIKNLRN